MHMTNNVMEHTRGVRIAPNAVGLVSNFSSTSRVGATRVEHHRVITRAANEQDISWDPEGLFKDQSTKLSVFQDGETTKSVPDVPTLDAKFLERYPIRPLKGTLSDLKRFKKMLADRYMPVDVDLPNVSVLHLDPPIFLVDGVFTEQECEDAIAKLVASERMAVSKVGSGNLYGSNVSSNDRRTSSSMLINEEVTGAYPEIGAFAESLQQKAYNLLQGHLVGTWGRPGRAMLHQQWAFEGMQAAVYERGQHFLEHEDAFPQALADENRFQRHATVLLYLNTVESGGETTFSHLGVSVKPQAGSLLIFFPAFRDGKADHRTLHIAKEAIDEKWVVQQWVARGFNSTLASHVAEQQRERDMRRTSMKALKAQKKRNKTKGVAGFG